MNYKLSELMDIGAAKLAPHKGHYFDVESEPEAGCAIGCILYAVGSYQEPAEMYTTYALGTPLRAALDTMVELSTLPVDIQALFPFEDGARNRYETLYTIITVTNDEINRERAIEITKALGF